ncbi:hypothetical protein CTAYLR_005290 [Chrysophaeum taylorii]|uniref:Arp2/3 complex 34 kDa subunit n=1 Tax=Chrysophaeum taylorii TaxID=2483200 RepID=A0AAD7ULK6_9STRA|nr:hypothetical protein CTAYLR_005290 [Chrysophaeum taylorii]
MLRVELHSSILEEALGSRLLDGKREPCELSVSDFDDCQFKLVVLPQQENILTLHVHVPCYDLLSANGAADVIDDVYAGMKTTPETGYQVAFSVNANEVSNPDETLARLIHVKRNLVGAPLMKAFNALKSGTAKSFEPLEIPWRQTESIFVQSGPDPANPLNYDRITVIFSIDFPEESDRAYCRIFLQQFQECQRKVNNAPPVVFSEHNNAPMEIRDKVAASSGIVGFVSLTIFASHVKTPEKLAKTVDLIVSFRNYLHFHIKAAKTNLHMRMRRKVDTWKQILNRAIQTSSGPKEMKTVTGKTFTRKT